MIVKKMNKIQTLSIFNNDVEHQQDLKLIGSLITYFKECIIIQIEAYSKSKDNIIGIKKIIQEKLSAGIKDTTKIAEVLSKAKNRFDKYSSIENKDDDHIMVKENSLSEKSSKLDEEYDSLLFVEQKDDNQSIEEYNCLLINEQKKKYELKYIVNKNLLESSNNYSIKINKLFSIIELCGNNQITNDINIRTCYDHLEKYDMLINKVNKLLEASVQTIIVNILQNYLNNIVTETKNESIKLYSDLLLKIRLENKLKDILDKKIVNKSKYIVNEKLEDISEKDKVAINDVIKIMNHKNKNPKSLISIDNKAKIEEIRNSEIRSILVENYYKAINGGLDIIICKFVLDKTV
jgi:hypothetical protein